MLICPIVPDDAEEFLMYGGSSRTIVLPNGVELIRRSECTTMVIPQDVCEIGYLPIYRKIDLSEIQVLPGSRLEKIGDCAFEGTNVREFVAPPSLREIGLAAFLNCRSLARVELNHEVKVGGLCFWGTQVQ